MTIFNSTMTRTEAKYRHPKRRKKGITLIVVIILIVTGLCILLYPILSDAFNSELQSRAIAEYDTTETKLTEDKRNAAREYVRTFNQTLAQMDNTSIYTLARTEDTAAASDALDIAGDGIIGYITITAIDVEMPIYRADCDTNVLLTASAHLAGTSLPLGGENTHCVIYAHRGLPSAQLFSSLDRLALGDRFTIRVLDEILTYEVDQILIVDPEDDSALRIVKGQDYCTLLTCTPYGINTHRLLVRGTRIQTDAEPEHRETIVLPIIVIATGVIAFGIIAKRIRKTHRLQQTRRTRWKKGLIK